MTDYIVIVANALVSLTVGFCGGRWWERQPKRSKGELPWGLCGETDGPHPSHLYRSTTLGGFRCTGRDEHGNQRPRSSSPP